MHLFSHIDYVLLENRACLMHFCISTILHNTWSRKTLNVCWVKLSLGHYTKLVISVFSPFAWCSRGASLLSTNKTKTLSMHQVSQAILGVLEMLFRMSPKSFRLITSFFSLRPLRRANEYMDSPCFQNITFQEFQDHDVGMVCSVCIMTSQ